ncbi:MAG: hypothetical protein ACD_17C00434G0003, partial [uncultured bacterium]
VKKGLIFVISAPAGTGKTTLVRMLREEFPRVEESVSFTTRLPRSNERPGLDYHFITLQEFEKKIQAGEFLEYAKVFGHYYGTSRPLVDERTSLGKHIVLVIDTQGALQLMDQLNAVFIFLSPPSIDELKSRLRHRNEDSDAEIRLRLSWAEKEMKMASRYSYHIVNDNLKQAYDVLRSIFIAEEHKNR